MSFQHVEILCLVMLSLLSIEAVNLENEKFATHQRIPIIIKSSQVLVAFFLA